MSSTENLAPRFITAYCSSALFLFTVLALLIPSGYSVGAVLLLLGGIYAYIKDRHTPLNYRDAYLLLLLALFSLEGIVSNVWHQLSSSHYDKALRYVLAIPAFYLIRWAKPKLCWLWLALVAGSVVTMLLAVYEVFILGFGRAGGVNNPIQYGNLSLLMGLFCLAGVGWAASLSNSKQRYLYVFLLLFGAACGALASLLSGSRGGWVGLPFVFLVLFRAYHSFFSLRAKISLFLLLVVAAVTVFNLPQLPIKERFDDAIYDVQRYAEGDPNTSVGLRFEMWRGAIELAKSKPLLGWGKDGYITEMGRLSDEGVLHAETAKFTHAHNELLDTVAKGGLIGLVALLALYLVPIAYFGPYLQHPNLSLRAVAVAGTLLPVTYIDFGLTQGFLTHNSGVMMYAFWLMIWAGYLRNTINGINGTKDKN